MSNTQHLIPRRPVLLIIMDGVGVNPARLNNGFALADTPRLDEYFSRNPLTLLQASGSAVGLPDGQMGNSEVGHLTLGCGEIIRQDLVAIDQAIADGSFYENAALRTTIAKGENSPQGIHLVGMVSDGGVHSHVRHLMALIELCQRLNARPIVHMICDGRDTAPRAILDCLDDLENLLAAAGGHIATVSGRYYTMDRDNRWDRTELAWRALVQGEGQRAATARAAIEQSYANDVGDEFILPTVINDSELLPQAAGVIYYNFRKDRVRQLTTALIKQDFVEFDRGDYQPIGVTCMTEYDEWYRQPFAFAQDKPHRTLAEVISRAGVKQFHCAETEKYAHVTYFLNGRHGDAFTGEDRVIVPSPKVDTYDQAPAMSAALVADEVIKAIESGQYGFIAVNFANGDMVGHTGVRDAIIKAVEVLDAQVGRVLDAAVAAEYSVVLTADHGNCDLMVDPATGAPHTQHTVFPVPCMIIDKVFWQLSVGAGLSSVAPTVLHLLGMRKPDSMTGRSLLLTPQS